MDTFDLQLTAMRPALLRTASSRLRNPVWAEDAVSETLLAALQRKPGFSAPGRVRAWLFGILRHKVVDQLRQHLDGDGSRNWSDGAEEDPVGEIGDPCPRADPLHCAAEREFMRALQRQLQRLPQAHADAFIQRECWGKDTDELCGELSVSAGNLWVMLHRTRHRLRQGLADHRV